MAAPPSIVTRSRGSLRVDSDYLKNRPLGAWMLAYAEWMVLGCVAPPTQSTRTTKARELSRLPLSHGGVRAVEARRDFRAYIDELNKGPLEQARAKFLARFPKFVDGYEEAFDAAKAAGDYRAMASISEPILDRVMPKRSEAAQVTQVSIVLQPEQIAALTSYSRPEVVADAVVEAQPD